MASAYDHVRVRSARNRVVDAIRIGDCYPITDLNVLADRLKVPFGGTAPIPITHAQSAVHYDLCDPKSQPLGAAYSGDGQDATLSLETPPVQEDVTYRIRATKASRSGGPPLVRFLEEPAPVKVGLDTTLVIEVGDVWLPGATTATPASLLDAAVAKPGPGDARLVEFGAAVDVKINRSQEGVEYSLIVDGEDVRGTMKMGDLGTITLRTPALREDAVVKVRATKRFLAADNRAPETNLLDARLLVKVKANPGLVVAVVGGPIVAYGGSPSLVIGDGQASATYQFFLQDIPDSDFIHGSAAGIDVTFVPVPGELPVQVRKPEHTDSWVDSPRARAVGQPSVQGRAGDLTLPVGASLLEDSMILVQATKAHRVTDDPRNDRVIRSSVRLDATAAILVRPDPRRRLSYRVPMGGERITGDVRISDGQPGVMYELVDKATAEVLGRPAYFHKRDPADNSQNKGIGQIAVEVDLIVPVPVTAAAAAAAELDRARQLARPPEVTLSATSANVTWRVSALKAQTRVSVVLEGDVVVGALSAIHAESPAVDSGAPARVVIEGSRAGERYELFAGGASVAGPTDGTGDPISLSSAPLTADTRFTVAVTRPADATSTMIRVVSVPVTVRPLFLGGPQDPAANV